MDIAITIFQVILLAASVALIICVLMQSSKSSGLGGAFGSDTQALSSRGMKASKEAKLQKLTIALAIMIGIAAIVLMIMSNHVS